MLPAGFFSLGDPVSDSFVIELARMVAVDVGVPVTHESISASDVQANEDNQLGTWEESYSAHP